MKTNHPISNRCESYHIPRR